MVYTTKDAHVADLQAAQSLLAFLLELTVAQKLPVNTVLHGQTQDNRIVEVYVLAKTNGQFTVSIVIDGNREGEYDFAVILFDKESKSIVDTTVFEGEMHQSGQVQWWLPAGSIAPLSASGLKRTAMEVEGWILIEPINSKFFVPRR